MSEYEQINQEDNHDQSELKENVQQGFTSSPSMAVEFSAHEGPLPSPTILQAYEKICSGAADRILHLAEVEQQHRIECEKISLSANIQDAHAERSAERRGQWQAFCVCITAILSGVILAFLDAPFAGIVLSGVTMLGVVAVFITRKWIELPSKSD